MLRRRQSVEEFLQETKKLTKDNVNTYSYHGVVDENTVPLYAAINIEEEDEVEAILKLHPNVFLGVEGEDQEYFDETAIGLVYLYHEDDYIGGLMEKYIEEVLGIKDGLSRVRAEEMWKEQRKPPPKRKTYYRTKSISGTSYRTKSITQSNWKVHPAYETPPALAQKPKANAHPRFKNLRH